jgi:hypothetical protein
VDALNQIQIEDRAGASPAELMAELEQVGPKAIATRQGLPLLLRALRVPFGPPLGFVRVDYLTDLIYPRDTWCHRLDICRATGREMILTAEHDGRIMALVMRELAAKIKRELKGITVGYELTGPAGGYWRVGSNGQQSVTIRMNMLDFSRLTSGRLTPDEVRSQSLADISGDAELASRVLDHTTVPY